MFRLTVERKHRAEVLKIDPFLSIIVKPCGNDIYHWKAWIIGTSNLSNCSNDIKQFYYWELNNTPYMDGKYELDIIIPTNYPFSPPKIKFITKMFHPNITDDGRIDLSVLKSEWSPALDLIKTLLMISALLHSPIYINDNAVMFNPKARKLFLENRLEYEKIVNLQYSMKFGNAIKQYDLRDLYNEIKNGLCCAFGSAFGYYIEPIIIEYLDFNINKLAMWFKDVDLKNDNRYCQLLNKKSIKTVNVNMHTKEICVTIANFEKSYPKLKIWSDNTIMDIKKIICDTEGFQINQLDLVCCGRVLETDKYVKDYNLTNKSILHMVLPINIV